MHIATPPPVMFETQSCQCSVKLFIGTSDSAMSGSPSKLLYADDKIVTIIRLLNYERRPTFFETYSGSWQSANQERVI